MKSLANVSSYLMTNFLGKKKWTLRFSIYPLHIKIRKSLVLSIFSIMSCRQTNNPLNNNRTPTTIQKDNKDRSWLSRRRGRLGLLRDTSRGWLSGRLRSRLSKTRLSSRPTWIERCKRAQRSLFWRQPRRFLSFNQPTTALSWSMKALCATEGSSSISSLRMCSA